MTPNNLGSYLNNYGIDWIAVTDHNSTRNVRVFSSVLDTFGIKVIPGIEIQTQEDIHILGYFPNCDWAEKMGEFVESKLPHIENNPEKYGYQLEVDENDNFISVVKEPLNFPCSMTLEETIERIQNHKGMPVYAHIDRSMGIIEQLGFIPSEFEDIPCEVYILKNLDRMTVHIKNKTILSSSDAHNLDSIKKSKMIVECECRNFDEFILAIESKNGRRIKLCL